MDVIELTVLSYSGNGGDEPFVKLPIFRLRDGVFVREFAF